MDAVWSNVYVVYGNVHVVYTVVHVCIGRGCPGFASENPRAFPKEQWTSVAPLYILRRILLMWLRHLSESFDLVGITTLLLFSGGNP